MTTPPPSSPYGAPEPSHSGSSGASSYPPPNFGAPQQPAYANRMPASAPMQPKKSNAWKWLLGCCLGLVLLFGIGGCGALFVVPSIMDNASAPADDDAAEDLTPSDSEDDASSTATPTPESSAPGTASTAPANDENSQALSKAQNYIDTMPMSKNGLKRQLTSEAEGFSEGAAQYAVDNLDVDYKANALESAKNYSETLHLSKAGLKKQLTSTAGEGYTEEEAQYAIENLKADYKKNALDKARIYRDDLNLDTNEIKEQLTSQYGEEFTEEEAQYAIDNLDK